MKTHTHHTTTYTYTIPDTEIEVELPFEPDCVMDYYDPLVKITDDKIILGYLAHDDDCESPLETDDFMGQIYECRRHGETLEKYCDALGLRYDGGGPNLDLVDEDKLIERAIEMILADPDGKAEALEFCDSNWDRWEEAKTDEEFLRCCLDTVGDLAAAGFDVEQLREEMWLEGRNDGTIGNKHAVLLDVYEHSGVAYILSGSGMQCQWDTAIAGAVWVPGKYNVEEIERRAAVYVKGDIIEMLTPGPNPYPFAVRTLSPDTLGYDDTPHRAFEHWHQALEYLKDLPGPLGVRDLATAERIAARELAKLDAENYTDWRNGNCFGVVVVTYDKAGVELEHDACWGFVGADSAYEALKNDYFPKED